MRARLLGAVTHRVSQTPIDRERWKNWASNGYGGEVVIGQDLQRVSIT
ncbi:hypothetical protein [Gordonia sihwensis]